MEKRKDRKIDGGVEMRESEAQTFMAVLFLACHLVVEGSTMQKERPLTA